MSQISNADQVLVDAWRDLLRTWAASGDRWRDQARAEFQAEHIEELEPLVRSAVNGIHEVNNLLRRAIQECGDR